MTTTLWIALRLALAAVLVASAATKVRDPRRFADDVSRYRMVPDRLAGPVAGMVIVVEAAAAALLAAGHPAGPVLAIASFVIFGIAVSVALSRGLAIPCGCFGGDEVVSRRALVRIALLALAGLAAMILSFGAPPAWSSGLDVVWAITAAVGLLLIGRLLLLLPDVRAAMGSLGPVERIRA